MTIQISYLLILNKKCFNQIEYKTSVLMYTVKYNLLPNNIQIFFILMKVVCKTNKKNPIGPTHAQYRTVLRVHTVLRVYTVLRVHTALRVKCFSIADMKLWNGLRIALRNCVELTFLLMCFPKWLRDKQSTAIKRHLFHYISISTTSDLCWLLHK